MFSFEGIKKYFMNTSWLLFEQIIRVGTNMVLTILIARHFSVGYFGDLNYAISYVALFAFLVNLGLDEILVREFINHPDDKYTNIGTAFFLRLTGSFLMMVCILVSFLFFSKSLLTQIMIMIFAFGVMFQSFQVINSYFQSQVKAKYFVMANSIAFVAASLMKIFYLIINAPIVFFILPFAIEFFVMAVGLIYIYQKTGNHMTKWKINFHKALYLLKNSWPLMLSSLAVTIYMEIDKVMTLNMINSTATGYYSAALTLAKSWYFFPVAISVSFFPAILASRKGDSQTYHSRLQLLYDLNVWTAITVAIITTFIGPFIIKLFFQEKYAFSGSILVVYIWSGIFVSFGLIQGKWLIAENLQKFTTLFIVVGAISNIILNYIFIKRFGTIGCAYATLLSQFISTVFCAAFFPKTRLSFFMFCQSLFPIRSLRYIFRFYCEKFQKIK